MNSLSYFEAKSHGTLDYPLAYYYVDERHPRYEMPFHWHREMEICYILAGEFTFYLNGTEIKALCGDTVFIDQGVLHGGYPQNCNYVCIVFDPQILLHTDICQKYMRFLMGSNIHITPHFAASNYRITEITRRLCKAAGSNAPGCELSTIGSLLEWFGYVYEAEQFSRYESDALPDKHGVLLMKPILEFIEKNYMTEITLNTLAQQAGVSPQHFCRVFKTIFHKTPIEYLTYYRIERACYLFDTTKLPVTEVSFRCGFNDSSYFTRIFKKQKGITPRQYQMQSR